MNFPKGFVWGAATAAYQIEGSASIDGACPSVWDMFCRTDGKTYGGQTGRVTCDHVRRYAEDVAIMKQIGLTGYRFSISWARVLPQGTGAVDKKGLDFYDRLVDELLGAGVTPYVTLFHWDHPYELFLRGGWLNPDSPQWFADYVAVIARRLGDRVKHWMTFNEPQCFTAFGHMTGLHAPGLRLGVPEVLRVAHNVLLSHGRAVQALRSECPAAPTIGYAPVGVAYEPATDSRDDIEAANMAMRATFLPELSQNVFWSNSWWMDPVIKGRYPQDGLDLFGAAMPPYTDSDMAVISQKIDFLGVNTYSAERVEMGPDGRPRKRARPDGVPQTSWGWTVAPESLYWGPKFFHKEYGLPLYITENGMANADVVSLDGCVHDPQRIDFLHRYLRCLGRAVADGADVRGYFLWSLMDNFEWAEGVSRRFGIVHVDYATQKRTLKDSATWYHDVIAANGVD